MQAKEQALRLLSQGHDYTEIATALGVPARQAHLITTGVAADGGGGGDGGDTVTRAERRRPGMVPSRDPAYTVEPEHTLHAREGNP